MDTVLAFHADLIDKKVISAIGFLLLLRQAESRAIEREAFLPGRVLQHLSPSVSKSMTYVNLLVLLQFAL